jgi:hypothetical protein
MVFLVTGRVNDEAALRLLAGARGLYQWVSASNRMPSVPDVRSAPG